MQDTVIYATEIKKRRDFESWKDVPSEFKTRNQWLRSGRKVKDREQPTARVVYPRIVPASVSGIVLEYLDEWTTLISDPPTALFHFDQTVDYCASPRSKAYEAFEDVFLRYSNKECHALKIDTRTDKELTEWFTVTAMPLAYRFQDRELLASQVIRKHINQKQIVAVKGTNKTRFLIIDLDYHGRDLEVFEAQAEILLDQFHGRGTWHYQVKRHDVTGLQLIGVFSEPQELLVVTERVESILKLLDRKHPELAQAARDAGMKTLAELEIYPDQNQAVRIPLCRDREMFLDAPLPLVTWRNGQVQDVEKYIQWIEDPNREYMPKEQVLDYLHYHASSTASSTVRPKKERKKSGETTAVIGPVVRGWRGNLKRWLVQFWLDGNANDRGLNEHLAILARLAASYGYSELDISERIKKFVGELPASAKLCSSRLLNGKLKVIDRVIETTAKYVCEKNGHQNDSTLSANKLKLVLAKWVGFDPLDKSTWDVLQLNPRAKVVPNWTDAQRRNLCVYLRKPLFVKDDSLILRFVHAIVNLTIIKERAGHGWHKDYLKKWMESNFPEINCGKAQKRQNILVALQNLGVICPLFKGRKGCFATHWTLGEMAASAVGLGHGDLQGANAVEIEQEAELLTS